jgi:exodeoxyribonuclease-5
VTTATSILSTDQAHALDRIADWHTSLSISLGHCNGSGRYALPNCPATPHTHGSGEAPVIALGGLAGTGKTTLIRALERELGAEAVFGTPTHKAASVLRKKLPGDQSHRVRTYHSLIYHMHAIYHCDITGRQVRRVVDHCVCNQTDACECPARFDPCTTKADHTCLISESLQPERREYLGGHRELVIIDESSMLSFEQVMDVRHFGVPVVLVGDFGQLPPILSDMNPWTRNPEVCLTHIHRQGADSGILQAAHDVRRHGYLTQNRYGNGDAVRYRLSDPVMGGVLDRWQPSPDRVIITHSNRLRAEINAAHASGQTPVPGDRVVALGGRSYETIRVEPQGTSYRATKDFLYVHNGMTGTVLHVSDRGGPTIDMVVQLDDHVLATPDAPVCLLIGGCARAQFGAQKDLAWNSPERPKNSRLWDYAYALTAHKAQGSEFSQVIVMDEGISGGGIYPQWMYTALTRAKDAVIVADYRR